MFFKIIKYKRGNQFLYVFDHKLPKRRKVSTHCEEEEAPVEFISKIEKYYLHFFIKQLTWLSSVF